MNVHNEIKPGDRIFSPAMCEAVLQQCMYEPQKKRNETGSLYVYRKAEEMRSGDFRKHSQIAFCRLNGGLILVDGYHRMMAVIHYGSGILFNVVIFECDTEEQVARIYASYDRWGENRIRTDAQALNALRFAEKVGVQKQVAEAAYKCMPIIRNGLRPINRGDKDTMMFAGMLGTRVDFAMEYKRQIENYNLCLHGCDMHLKRRLLNISVMSIALITLKFKESMALDFWSSVSNNSGLTRGMPEHTLVNALLNRKEFTKPDVLMKAVALAWNHYYRGSSVIRLNADNSNFTLLGTPFKGGWAE